MGSNVVSLRSAPVSKRSRMETLVVELTTVGGWRIPPFQRPLRVNDKVRMIADQIRDDGGVIPGVITIGKLVSGRHAGEYLLDGQHRVEAFRISECAEALADIRYVEFESMAEMGAEFVALNSQIVRMRPDDVLRGLEDSVPTLKMLREACPFIGYDYIRRNPTTSPIVSVSTVLRIWEGSAAETPVAIGKSAVNLANDMTGESAEQLKRFLLMLFETWGRDDASKRLWSSLNMSVIAWIYRRLVLNTERPKSRILVLRSDQFKKCLAALAANGDYSDFLLGRQLGDRDRAPCYSRIKAIFTRRLLEEKFSKGSIVFPAPAWARV